MHNPTPSMALATSTRASISGLPPSLAISMASSAALTFHQNGQLVEDINALEGR